MSNQQIETKRTNEIVTITKRILGHEETLKIIYSDIFKYYSEIRVTEQNNDEVKKVFYDLELIARKTIDGKNEVQFNTVKLTSFDYGTTDKHIERTLKKEFKVILQSIDYLLRHNTFEVKFS